MRLPRLAEEADLCVVNSSAVTGEAARQSRQLARRLARANPAARLVVTGCYATLEGETAAQLPNVDLVVGNARKDELLALIEAEVESSRLQVESSDIYLQPATLTCNLHLSRNHPAPAPSSKSRTAAATAAPSAS